MERGFHVIFHALTQQNLSRSNVLNIKSCPDNRQITDLGAYLLPLPKNAPLLSKSVERNQVIITGRCQSFHFEAILNPQAVNHQLCIYTKPKNVMVVRKQLYSLFRVS